MLKKETEIKFCGRVVRCIYNTADFKIYAFDVDKEQYPDIQRNKYNNVSVMGDLSDLTCDVQYEITATQEQTKHGVGYRVKNIRRDTPASVQDTYLFLSEILTQNQAKVLCDHYPDIIDRVKTGRLEDIDLKKLHGIGEYTFNIIKNKIIDNFALADLVVEFQGYLSLTMVKKLFLKYGSIDHVKKALARDPYKCMCGLAGVGFKTADATLLELEKLSIENIKNGKPPIITFSCDLRSSPQRCFSCMLHLLEENEMDGHTQMNLVDLRAKCMSLVPACAHHFTDVIKQKEIYYDKERLVAALSKTYLTEKKIADTILSCVCNAQNVWDYDIEKYRRVGGADLSDEQLNAVRNVCRYSISILNGAGGTGKSFSTQAVIRMLNEHGHTFCLFSPTGKAAKVLSEYTGEKASTIHRGLDYNPGGHCHLEKKNDSVTEYITPWGFDKNNKLSADVIIVDEFSMVDIRLFEHLIDAIDFETTKLLLIGDNAQLPSVSCGNLLHDFMSSGIIPTTTLSKVFRYGEGGLMKIATDVRCCAPYLSKEMRQKKTDFGKNKDYTFVDLPPEQMPQMLVALYRRLLESGNGVENIQVLTAQKKGDCGTEELNKKIQAVANPNYGTNLSLSVGETTYYIGDLVLQHVNNYKAPLYNNQEEFDPFDCVEHEQEPKTAFVANGETGVIVDIVGNKAVIDFDGISVCYSKEEMNDVGLGYVITIHKSQGSSIDNVILCTPQAHTFMMNSNLLYVGLTRMRKRCFHLGSLSTVNQAVLKKANLKRQTFMQSLLTKDQSKALVSQDIAKYTAAYQEQYDVAKQAALEQYEQMEHEEHQDNLPWYSDAELKNLEGFYGV